MKLLPLPFACLLSFTAHAQNQSGYIQQFRQKMAELKNPQRLSTDIIRKDTTKQASNSALFLTNPKPGVHRLPQDNMPCLVPDPTATVSIPNAWQGEIKIPYTGNPPRIPNPVKPLTPSRPLLITPPDTK